VEFEHHFRTSADLGEVKGLRVLFARALTVEGVQGEELEIWKLLFTELVQNAIEHGCTGGGDAIVVQYKVTAEEVVLRTIDPSEGRIAAEDVHSADGGGFLESGRGAGLFLLKAYSDEVAVQRAPHGGTMVRVTRKRGGAGSGKGVV
jgi:anti-sigma regulatory factor (Ser/Thr protein kinase)